MNDEEALEKSLLITDHQKKQIKITMRYNYKAFRMAKGKKTEDTMYW